MDAISCLPPLPASTYMSTSAAACYTDAAVARALPFSMPASASSSELDPCSSSPLFADFVPGAGGCNWFASGSSPPMVESVLVATTPASNKRQQQQLGCRAGGPGKRRAKRRPSKRAPTTYISTDTANFRFMVQHVTGALHHDVDVDGFFSPAAASSLLLAQDDAASYGAAFGMDDDGLLVADDGAAALQQQHHRQQQEQQQQACFPTLDSWSVMCHNHQI
ncbi:uncharacterized protein LOC100820849 [Brachypodium distachyon]|uniref:VQ domain-containing protein n=1 Tax=Brachypodium distachyon TaxID=15368 RepID=I1GR03_BRADI|nr:uncharacterized protein LOC100820849 [Brachypodium distachyon]KQK14563.1 hypothetical protein BRADI_1g17290v3 [Brachypodium distachyon]|eukprot:XP_003559770.1 uncharacterized protein LOC100820849 [Brachypodium distachyon]